MDDPTPTDSYLTIRRRFNDLQIVAGQEVTSTGFTLLAILRNEIYFLPKFFAHYRGLGVERFVFLNDRSDDGSLEYLLQQPDTIVVESNRTYGDAFEVPKESLRNIKHPRVMYLWRGMLHDMFARDRWALQVDLDEFVHLPYGLNFPDLVDRLERQNARAVWGVMLDVYPENCVALAELENAAHLDTAATWYFDGEPHLRLRRDKTPRMLYPGARARLYGTYDVDKLYRDLGVRLNNPAIQMLKKMLPGVKPRGYNSLYKPTLIKWNDNSYFESSHRTNLPASSEFLLPIQHFRFAGPLSRKVQLGIREKSYYRDSLDHRLLAKLLERMKEKSGSFLYPKSRAIDSYEDFSGTRNAVGF